MSVDEGCRLCGAPRREVVSLGRHPVSTHYGAAAGDVVELALWVCTACQLLQLLDAPPPERVRSLTPDLKFREPEAHLDAVADLLLGCLPSASSIKALGATDKDTSVLDRLKARGVIDARVLDPGADLRVTHPCAGLETFQAALTVDRARTIARSAPATVVIARHILEHAHEPLVFLRALSALIDDHGLVVVEVPDFSRCLRSHQHCFIWEEHTTYFEMDQLEDALWAAGLQPVELIRFDNTYEDSLVAIARKGKARPPRERASSGRLDAIRSFGDSLPARVRAAREAVTKLAEGKPVALIGAGHIAMRFLYFHGLVDRVQFVVDDDPTKQGKTVPGTTLPIVERQALAESDVRLVLLGVGGSAEARVASSLRTAFSSPVVVRSIFSTSPHALVPVMTS